MQRGQNTYGAYVRRAGKQVHLGSYVTAEEAALVYARSPLPPNPKPNPNPNPNPKPWP